jgi:predicted site-specific integrase-resolvase
MGVIMVAFKDRLTRFGFRYLERYLSSHGVRIEVVNGRSLRTLTKN